MMLLLSKHWLTVITAGATTVILVGCTQSSTTQPASTPEFSGPHKEQISALYQEAREGFPREALRDGVVTEQERAEVIERFRTCLNDHGFSLDFNLTNGSYITQSDNKKPSETDQKRADTQISECENSSGVLTVDFLYRQVRANPENRPYDELIVECLLRKAAVAPGYTTTDFNREYPNNEVKVLRPELRGTPEDPVKACEDDPLGLVAGESQ